MLTSIYGPYLFFIANTFFWQDRTFGKMSINVLDLEQFFERNGCQSTSECILCSMTVLRKRDLEPTLTTGRLSVFDLAWKGDSRFLIVNFIYGRGVKDPAALSSFFFDPGSSTRPPSLSWDMPSGPKLLRVRPVPVPAEHCFVLSGVASRDGTCLMNFGETYRDDEGEKIVSTKDLAIVRLDGYGSLDILRLPQTVRELGKHHLGKLCKASLEPHTSAFLRYTAFYEKTSWDHVVDVFYPMAFVRVFNSVSSSTQLRVAFHQRNTRVHRSRIEGADPPGINTVSV